MLDELATLMPKRLWLTKLEEKGGSLAFTGNATSIDDVSEFMTALKGSRHFRSVELGKTAAKGDSKVLRLVDFTLSASVVYPPNPVAPAAPAAARADHARGRPPGRQRGGMRAMDKLIERIAKAPVGAKVAVVAAA